MRQIHLLKPGHYYFQCKPWFCKRAQHLLSSPASHGMLVIMANQAMADFATDFASFSPHSILIQPSSSCVNLFFCHLKRWVYSLTKALSEPTHLLRYGAREHPFQRCHGEESRILLQLHSMEQQRLTRNMVNSQQKTIPPKIEALERPRS